MTALDSTDKPVPSEVGLGHPGLEPEVPQILPVFSLCHASLDKPYDFLRKSFSKGLSQVAGRYGFASSFDVGPGERIEMALRAKAWTKTRLAKALGITQQSVSQLVAGRFGRSRYEEIARILNVPLEWITVGENPPRWVGTAQLRKALLIDPPVAEIPTLGEVSAGDGFIKNMGEMPPFRLRPGLSCLRVRGKSAYPVVYPDQWVILDTDRAFKPPLDEATGKEMHNYMVCVQTSDEADATNAYLKRFCYTPKAPGGYVLASVNSGLDSPFIEPATVLVIVPVVGVLYEE